MASLDARLKRLEERRQQEAVDLMFERARVAGLDDVAKFLTAGLELERAGREGMAHEMDAEREARAWAYLNIPPKAVRLAEPNPELWCEQLGDTLADKRGLRGFLWEHYPDTARWLYGRRGAAS